jgi:hypothetical protein
MTKNGIALSVVAVILALAYIRYFTDWFSKETIQIIPQIRPGRASNIPRPPGAPPVSPVSFAFDGKYRLTSVKVVAAEDYATNKYANPLWYLISDSNSVPTKAIVYGFPIKGMKPATPRARPEPLQPGVPYIMMVEAGKVRAQTNFHTLEAVQPGGQ